MTALPLDRSDVMHSIPEFTTLAEMREQAWASARAADDPLTAQQYRELAQCYDAALIELQETGITVVPSHDAATIPWRSVQLRTSDDS